ncbi:WXG100 family type VII secretion target [Dactylosporangium sucinum]|uniref:ESAT-6-like protein n=1 Tax=Dactylosporangium sucinum TaxID=1424081 RepID=A0A917U6X6_9ACTN|nr:MULTISPECIES: WXG100 family type VII secretion target [Dactylosporangium]WVK86714.1 WXG100 family type VII secretion target [Dactylosporangium sp. AC04546]GGM63399.1 hypothetical protein GCM10007977_076210 [Dactylosporangium sucinum]
MATYSLNPNGLLDSSEELRGVTRSIENALADLNGYVNQFITANAGGAASSYQVAQTTWNSGLDQMNAALDRGATAIDEIRSNYQIADTQGASLFEGNV